MEVALARQACCYDLLCAFHASDTCCWSRHVARSHHARRTWIKLWNSTHLVKRARKRHICWPFTSYKTLVQRFYKMRRSYAHGHLLTQVNDLLKGVTPSTSPHWNHQTEVSSCASVGFDPLGFQGHLACNLIVWFHLQTLSAVPVITRDRCYMQGFVWTFRNGVIFFIVNHH